MTVKNQHWYNTNESRFYPLHDVVSGVDDNGNQLPTDIITDLKLIWPRYAGDMAFVSSVSVTAGAISVTIQVTAFSELPIESQFAPLAVISVPVEELEVGRQYPLLPQFPQTSGYITFGSGVNRFYNGRFSSPRQSQISPNAGRSHVGLPVKSIGELYSGTALTGVVDLIGRSPVEIVSGQRTINGKVENVIVIQLTEEGPDSAFAPEAESVFKQYSGPCSSRPESKTCSDPLPVEYINAVGPDCNGLLTIDVGGFVDVGLVASDSSIVLDVPLELEDACVPPYLPDHEGVLPFETAPLEIEPPEDEEPPVEDPIDDTYVVLGELPFCFNFYGREANGFPTKKGAWVYQPPESLEIRGDVICPPVDLPFPGSLAVDTLGTAKRNVVIWNGFDISTFHRTVETDVRLMAGFPGTLHNGGIVINYLEETADNAESYYWFGIDYDTLSVKLSSFNGNFLQTLASKLMPGLNLEQIYRLKVQVTPVTGQGVYVLGTVNTLTPNDGAAGDDSSEIISLQLGPVLLSQYRSDEGKFGFGTNRAVTRFCGFKVDMAPQE